MNEAMKTGTADALHIALQIACPGTACNTTKAEAHIQRDFVEVETSQLEFDSLL